MARGYYVIPSDEDPIEFTGRGAKSSALKKAKEIFDHGDLEVFIQQFNDDDPDGYFASGKVLFIKNLERGCQDAISSKRNNDSGK